MARSANNQLGETAERWYKNKILRNKSYNMTVAMRTDKCCAASGRALQVESAASKMQRVKIHLRKTLQNRSKYMDENKFATMNSLHKDSLYTKIRDIMRNNNFLTLKGCKEKLENEISVAQLSKEIKKAGLSKKQIKKKINRCFKRSQY